MRIYLSSFLFLSALPLVWYSGTTWKSNSDDLILTLISIENWRIFFWGQNRFGTLVPLLAKPFTEMRWNLLFQNFIQAFSLVVFLFAVSRAFYQKQKEVVSRTLIYIFLILIFLTTNVSYLDLLRSGLPYAAPLGIFGLSLLIANSNSKKSITVPALIFLISVSCWINPLNGYYLAPLLILVMSLKKFKNIFYELSLTYLLVNFGVFFIILGLSNGEIGGIVSPNFSPFKVYNWWLSLITIQLILVSRAIYLHEFKKSKSTYFGFLLTWFSIFALTSLRHIQLNSGATRYFITATFVSMCITMRILEEILSESSFLKTRALRMVDLLFNERILTASLLFLLLANVLIARNLVSDYPLEKPKKQLLNVIFENNREPYRFASGDYWYAWPTKLYVEQPKDIFLTSFRTENQYDISTESKKIIQSRFKSGDLGLCFGEVKQCRSEIRAAAFRMYGQSKVQVDVSNLTLLARDPILVHKLRLSITSKQNA